jgi:hypothetical protein
MREFYERFYAVVPSSAAHARFCQRAFGLDLGQHASPTWPRSTLSSK